MTAAPVHPSLEPTLPVVSATDHGLSITWPDGETARFHAFWLRENCRCPACCHPDAWERIVGLLDIPLDVRPLDVTTDERGLHLRWGSESPPCDGTSFSWRFLRDHRTEAHARRAAKRVRSPWRGSDLDRASLTFAWPDVAGDDASLATALRSIDEIGIALVSGVPTDSEAVFAVAERIAHVQESHFGRSFTVESRRDPTNLAFTPRRLEPHNDLPSRTELPGLQLLHCLVNDAVGGESILVDGLAVAERLRREQPDAFGLLTTTAVRYSSFGPDWEVTSRKPVIELDTDGDVVGTCLHPALLGPVDVEPDSIAAFYQAYRSMLSIAVDPSMQFSFRLAAGDCQIFHNRRILHARHSFDPGTGDRRLHGCYVPFDDFASRLAVLERDGVDFRQR